jgi:hypothetical protein
MGNQRENPTQLQQRFVKFNVKNLCHQTSSLFGDATKCKLQQSGPAHNGRRQRGYREDPLSERAAAIPDDGV